MDDLDLYDMLRGLKKSAQASPAAALRKPVFRPNPVPAVVRMKRSVDRMKDVVKKLPTPPKQKLSGLTDFARETAEGVKEYILTHKPELLGGALGAATAGTIGYRAMRRKNPNQPSEMEEEASDMRRSHREALRELRRDKKEPGLPRKLIGVGSKAYGDLAKVMKDHPVAGAAVAASSGVSVGSKLGRFIADRVSGGTIE